MNRNFLKSTLVLFMIPFALVYCTKKPEKSKAVLDLEKSYKNAQEELSKFDAKIKAAAGDEGLIIYLKQEQELAKSRVMRVKEQLQTVSPESLVEAPAEGGGHGGGH